MKDYKVSLNFSQIIKANSQEEAGDEFRNIMDNTVLKLDVEEIEKKHDITDSIKEVERLRLSKTPYLQDLLRRIRKTRRELKRYEDETRIFLEDCHNKIEDLI